MIVPLTGNCHCKRLCTPTSESRLNGMGQPRLLPAWDVFYMTCLPMYTLWCGVPKRIQQRSNLQWCYGPPVMVKLNEIKITTDEGYVHERLSAKWSAKLNPRYCRRPLLNSIKHVCTSVSIAESVSVRTFGNENHFP